MRKARVEMGGKELQFLKWLLHSKNSLRYGIDKNKHKKMLSFKEITTMTDMHINYKSIEGVY